MRLFSDRVQIEDEQPIVFIHHRTVGQGEVRWNLGALLRRLATHLARWVAVDDQITGARAANRRRVCDVDVLAKRSALGSFTAPRTIPDSQLAGTSPG